MIAEVISIGDEITSGQRLDTNSQWISQQLGDLGINVAFHTTVTDSLQANQEVFQIALQRADVCVSTGGLGPTADDLTRHAIANTLGVGLYRDEASLAHIRDLFARRNRQMPPTNEIQADFPEGSHPIANANGSAPGIDIEIGQGDRIAYLMAFPGVPAELKEMFLEFGKPRLEKILGKARKFIVHKPIRCFGIGESDLESRLPDLIKRGRDPQVGITASFATITLRITAEGKTESECWQKISETETIIRESLGEIVFGENDDELQDVIYRELLAREKTLALAEIGTGGLLSHLFSRIDPKGQVFAGGWIARNRETINTLTENDASAELGVVDLAEKTKKTMGTDFAIAIGGFPANEKEPLGIAIATPAETIWVKRTFGGHPSLLLPRAAKQGMNELRLWLRQNN